ncbi:MAG: hypothetical protein ACRDGM_07080 [bacterium]
MKHHVVLSGVVSVLSLFVVLACASVRLSKLPKMTVEPEGRLVVDGGRGLQQGCAVWVPQLRLTGVPATATQLETQVSDPDHPDPPRGWYVPYVSYWPPRTVLTVTDGSIVLKAHGIGPAPCPPGGASRYHIEVVVRDRQEEPLAYGSRMIEVARERAAPLPSTRCQMRGAGERFIMDCP